MSIDNYIIGLQLNDSWKITASAESLGEDTGGNFSIGYIAEKEDGTRGFVKVLNLSRIQNDKNLKGDNLAARLKEVVDAFVYETMLIEICKKHDRVITALSSGEMQVKGIPFDILQYVIFEIADGNVRSQADLSRRFDDAFSLRALHHIATGIRQMHSENIAHQDIKPSNVLVFEKKGSKLGDLGHAEIKSQANPRGNIEILGDPVYAPVEHKYRYVSAEWDERRFGADCYLLGSMIVFFFTGVPINVLFSDRLHPDHHWNNYQGKFQDILPHLRFAFNEILKDIESDFPEKYKDELILLIRQLCDPDPALRGDPKNRKIGANQYSMERYVSRLANLASKAEYSLKTNS